MSENYKAVCTHCSKHIKWSGTFGWYHGVMGAGWNTTCNDGEGATRAEPTEEVEVDASAKEQMVDALQAEAMYMSWDAVYYYREDATHIVDFFIKAGWTPPGSDM